MKAHSSPIMGRSHDMIVERDGEIRRGFAALGEIKATVQEQAAEAAKSQERIDNHEAKFQFFEESVRKMMAQQASSAQELAATKGVCNAQNDENRVLKSLLKRLSLRPEEASLLQKFTDKVTAAEAVLKTVIDVEKACADLARLDISEENKCGDADETSSNASTVKASGSGT